jgi:hypothetical protein
MIPLKFGINSVTDALCSHYTCHFPRLRLEILLLCQIQDRPGRVVYGRVDRAQTQ